MNESYPPPGHEGAITTVLTLASCAPSAEFMLLERTMGAITIRVTYSIDRRLRAAAFDTSNKKSTALLTVTSCPLSIERSTRLILTVTWCLPGSIDIFVNKMHLTSMSEELEMAKTFIVPSQNSIKKHDFSQENALVIDGRHQRLVGHQPIPRRTRQGSAYMKAALESEALQVRDLLSLIRQDALHHVLGLASRLRLLVADGNPLPLLQHCAGAVKAPLIAYTDSTDGALRDAAAEKGFDLWRGPNLAAKPRGLLINAVDIDVWLRAHAARAFGRDYTHREIIYTIGNTVASHVDYDLPDVILELKSLRSQFNITNAPQDLLIMYVLQVAKVALSLVEAVVQHEL
jgi:hypothetical protein